MTTIDTRYAEDWFIWVSNQVKYQFAHPRHFLILLVILSIWTYWAYGRGFDASSIEALTVPSQLISYALTIFILAAATSVELRADEQNQRIISLEESTIELSEHILRLEKRLALAQGVEDTNGGH